MPKIDFYVIPDEKDNARYTFACRLIEKAYKNQHRIYIHSTNEKEAHLMDELLWTYRDDSFLPHHLYGEGGEPLPPIQIGFDVTSPRERDILINLSKDVPSFFTQFNRVIELVSEHSDIQTFSREHYRFYRAQGFDITTHKLTSIHS